MWPAPQQWGDPRAHFVAYVQGEDLVVTKLAPLPDVCVKCGTREGLARKLKKFTWVSPWVWLLAIVSVLIAAIIAAILQKRGELWLPLCARCKSRWTIATVSMVLTVLGIFAAIFLPLIIAGAFDAGDAIPILLLVSFVLWIVGLVLVSLLVVKPRTIWPKKIDDRVLTLRGVHPDARAAICQAAAAYAQQAPSWQPR